MTLTLEATTTPAALADLPLYDGIFTVGSPKGGHVTLRVRVIRNEEGIDPQSFEGKNLGRQIVSVLTGPNNTWNSRDFKGIGFSDRLVESGKAWKNATTENTQKVLAFVAMVKRFPMGQKMAQMGYVLTESRRCYKCGKVLTTPASIEAGIGPVCAKGGKD